MRLLLFIIATTFSIPSLADYYSAARQVREQREARDLQERAARVPKNNERLISSIHRVAALHGGLVSGPSIGATSELGTYYKVGFATRDGWECLASGGELQCANTSLGKSFYMFYWQDGKGQYSGDAQGFLGRPRNHKKHGGH